MMRTSRKQSLHKENVQDANHVSAPYSDITLNATLSYISQILLEEDLEGIDTLYHKESELSEMEKLFYEILGQKYPYTENEVEIFNPLQIRPTSIDQRFPYQQNSDNQNTVPASEFNKGVEEGMKFLPSIDRLINNFQANKFSPALVFDQGDYLATFDIDGEEEENNFMKFALRGKKKSNVALEQLERRNQKISVPYSDETARRNATFDKVLLKHDNFMHEDFISRKLSQRNTIKCSENDCGETKDVESLLIECSDAVYANDHQLAADLLSKMRNQCSPKGDATQRMVLAFCDALDARLTGTGSEVWRRNTVKRIPTFEVLRIAQLFITACPFPKTSMYYANKTILSVTKKASTLHIVDFGIGFGFQWPSLIQALSQSKEVTKLRVTGIDFPRPGFRPTELVEETGRRLEDYARSFNIPFEYHGITSKNWEEISLDDMKIKNQEVLIVNSLYRLRQIGDEAVSLDSPRDRVLNLIYQMRPEIFIEGVLSIQSFSPFFITRFRQALGLFSALFQVLDISIPRDNTLRLIMERDFLANDILNIIACEGPNWTWKPESYKQWHQRNLRAGFEQVPLDHAIVKECREIMSKGYKNKIFFIEEDKNWMLQSWTGRAFDALSTWKPKSL